VKALRSAIQLLGMVFLIGITFWFGWECGKLAKRYPEPFTPKKKLVIERVMDIQREVGCVKIDGEIGPESKTKINKQTKLDEPEYFNKLAAPYFTPSGAKEN